MVLKFKVSKSMIVVKIALSRLVEDYPKIMSTLFRSIIFLKNLEIVERSL